MKNFELIDLYFDNSLSPKEQLLFNDLLQNDLDFKNEFIFRKDLKKVIAVSQQEDLKASLGQFEDKIQQNSKLMMLPKKWLVAASVFILASFGLYSVKTVYFPSNEVIYETYFTSCRNTIQPVVRGVKPNTIEYRAFVAYEAHDYYKAINLFNSVANPEASYINFYKGLSCMEINKLTRAIELLYPITKAENLEGKSADFDAKAKWYLALAYIKNNDNKKAIEELSLISNQPSGTFKKEEALEVLAFLK